MREGGKPLPLALQYLIFRAEFVYNISFVFWAMEFQEKMLLRFTDL